MNPKSAEATNKMLESRTWTIYTTTYYIGLEMKPLEPDTEASSPVWTHWLRRPITVIGYLDQRSYIQIDLYILGLFPAGYQRSFGHPRAQVRLTFSRGAFRLRSN